MNAKKLEKGIWISEGMSKKLKPLRPVFQALVDVHQEYIDADSNGSGDCPYWYGERPHVGFLAAAVWKNGGVALEEYGTSKRNEHKFKRGRCDLWIKIRQASFECEAKHLWLNLGRIKENINDIKNEAKKAKRDVKKLQNKVGISLCFVTPVIRQSKLSKLKDANQELVKSLKDKLKNGSSWCDALVWIGFKKGQEKRNKNHYYTGLLIIIKAVGI